MVRRRRPSENDWQRVADRCREIASRRPPEIVIRVLYPEVLRLLGSVRGRRVLDVGCGSGAFTRRLASRGAEAVGLDVSPELIDVARHDAEEAGPPEPRFEVADIQKASSFPTRRFDAATFVLSLQTLSQPERVLRNTANLLKASGQLILAVHHPCFRIPGSTHWGSDPDRDVQFRRIDRYRSSHPIEPHPAGDRAPVRPLFHWPLERIFGALRSTGFVVEDLVEPVSDATSGRRSESAEDRARREIPLFLILLARRRPRRPSRKPGGSG